MPTLQIKHHKASVTLVRGLEVCSINVRDWVETTQPHPFDFWNFIDSISNAMQYKGEHLVNQEMSVARGTFAPTFRTAKCLPREQKSGQSFLV